MDNTKIIVFALLLCSVTGNRLSGQNAHPDLTSIFLCNDQSALINNFVSSQDPPPGAWSFLSTVQSPVGKISFPQVITINKGNIYTSGDEGELVEHHLTRHSWLPWLYSGIGKQIKVNRTVGQDIFKAQVQLSRDQKGLVILEVESAQGLDVIMLKTQNGIQLIWKEFITDLQFSEPSELIIANDPDLLKQKFLDPDHFVLSDGIVRGIFRKTYIGCIFKNSTEFQFAVINKKEGKIDQKSFSDIVKAENKRWEDFFNEQVPPLTTKDPVLMDTYYFAWQVIWANHCTGGGNMLKYPFTSPARLHYGSQWWWDEAFHACVFSHLNDKTLAYDWLKNFIYAQQPDGMIPGSIRFTADYDNLESIGFIPMSMQPPVIGLSLDILRKEIGYPEDLKPLYDMLLRNMKWHMSKARDFDQDGLLEYHHSFDGSADQTQRWDTQKFNKELVIDSMKPTESVDFNVWAVLLWYDLADMADALGDKKAAEEHRLQGKLLHGKIETFMWDEKDGFYYDIDGTTKEKIRVKTPYGFMPMLLKKTRPERIARLVNEHILNKIYLARKRAVFQ